MTFVFKKLQEIDEAKYDFARVKPCSFSEDAIAATSSMAMIADGATGLATRRLLKEYNSDAQWLAHSLVQALKEIAAVRENPKTFTPEYDNPEFVLAVAIEKVRKHAAQDFIRGLGKIEKYELPTCTLVLAMLSISNPDEISFINVADGNIFFSHAGHMDVYSGSRRLEQIEAQERRILKFFRSNGYSDADVDDVALKIQKKRRSGRNTPKSYSVVDLTPQCVQHPETSVLTLSVSEDDTLVLSSDGLMRMLQGYRLLAEDEFHAIASEKGGLAVLLEKLRQHERDHPEKIKPVYIKVSDDVSALQLQVMRKRGR